MRRRGALLLGLALGIPRPGRAAEVAFERDAAPSPTASPPPASPPQPPPPVAVAPSALPLRPPAGAAGAAGYVSVVRAAPAPATDAREDRSASSSVLLPADSPRVGADLATQLAAIPGVNITRRGGLGSLATLSLRGGNPDEVRVYVDGVPLNQAVGGAVDLSTLPMGDVERIEIYRGVTPLAFGESALGGVVSITTRAPERGGFTAGAGLGSFGTRSGDLTAAAVLGRLTLYGGGHVIRADGDFPVESTLSPTGRRENNDLLQLDGTFRATLALPGRRELRAGFLVFDRAQGVPAADLFVATGARAHTSRAVADLAYASRGDLGASSRLRVLAFAAAAWDRFSDPLYKIFSYPVATRDLTRAVGTSATAEKSLGEHLRWTANLEGRAESYRPHNDADPTMPAGHPASRQVATAGFEIDGRIPRLELHVIPSGRVEAVRDVRVGRDATFGTSLPPSPPTVHVWPVLRLGLLRPIGSDWQLRANVGRYARIPTFVELYGYNQGFLGNGSLRPERGTNADVGVAFRHEVPGADLTASAALFAARAEDLIEWETYSYQTRAENVSRARIWGAEAELRARAGRLAVVAQSTLTDARDEGPIASRHDRQLAHHPRYRAYLRGEWRQPARFLAGAVTAYADADATAGNFRATSLYGEISPRLIAGAGVALEVTPRGLRLSLSVYDLLDSRVEDFPGYPLPGRSFLLAMSWSPPPARVTTAAARSPSPSPSLATNK